jgi:hypothetical protein
MDATGVVGLGEVGPVSPPPMPSLLQAVNAHKNQTVRKIRRFGERHFTTKKGIPRSILDIECLTRMA